MSSRRAAEEKKAMNRVADDSAWVIELPALLHRTDEPAKSGVSLDKIILPAEALKSPHTGQRLVDALAEALRAVGRG